MNKFVLPLPKWLAPYRKVITFVLGQVLAALAYHYLDSASALIAIQLLTGAGIYQQPNKPLKAQTAGGATEQDGTDNSGRYKPRHRSYN